MAGRMFLLIALVVVLWVLVVLGARILSGDDCDAARANQAPSFVLDSVCGR